MIMSKLLFDAEWLARKHDDEELDAFTFYLYLSISVALVIMAGAMSGLTLGLMSLDTVDLEILKRSGEPQQKLYAARIVPVLKRPHVLLVTLLLCNAAAMEALPLFLDRLADPVTAIIVSVTAVLAFGEIIPQALCSRYGLQIGAAAAPLVKVLMWLTWPISGPVGWLLDQILGERHSALFRRGELKALVDIHKEGQEFGGMLTADEVNIIKGALDLTHKIAMSAMTPLDMVFMLPSNAVLDEDTLTAVIASGHSRIPIHRPGNRGEILGILLVKELIIINKDDKRPVGRFKIRSVPYLRADTPMYDMLKLFEIGRSHMAVLMQPSAAAVMRRKIEHDHQKISQIANDMDSIDDIASTSSCPGTPKPLRFDYDPADMEPVGIITIEDVLEELLQSEIVDETDQYVDNLHSERVNAALLARGLPAHLRSMLTSRNLVPRIGGAAFMTTAPYMTRHDSHEDAIAAGQAAAEAGLFRSQPGSEDGTMQSKGSQRKSRCSSKKALASELTANSSQGEVAGPGGTVLSPRHKEQAEVAAASLVTLALQKRAAAQQQGQGQDWGGRGGDPRLHASSHRTLQGDQSAGGSVHGGHGADRSAGLRAGQSRRSKQLTQGIKDQMDLLQPLLQRAVTADTSSLVQEAAAAGDRRRRSVDR